MRQNAGSGSIASDTPPGATAWLRLGVVVAALVVAACVGCAGVSRLWVRPAPGGLPRAGYVLDVCVGRVAGPRWGVGVTWAPPYISSLPPVLLDRPACVLAPWLPWLPQRGGWQLP